MNNELTSSEPRKFISRDRDHWRKPSYERILRVALAEALKLAKNKEIPPDDIIQVWEMIIKDSQ